MSALQTLFGDQMSQQLISELAKQNPRKLKPLEEEVSKIQNMSPVQLEAYINKSFERVQENALEPGAVQIHALLDKAARDTLKSHGQFTSQDMHLSSALQNDDIAEMHVQGLRLELEQNLQHTSENVRADAERQLAHLDSIGQYRQAKAAGGEDFNAEQYFDQQARAARDAGDTGDTEQ